MNPPADRTPHPGGRIDITEEKDPMTPQTAWSKASAPQHRGAAR